MPEEEWGSLMVWHGLPAAFALQVALKVSLELTASPYIPIEFYVSKKLKVSMKLVGKINTRNLATRAME